MLSKYSKESFLKKIRFLKISILLVLLVSLISFLSGYISRFFKSNIEIFLEIIKIENFYIVIIALIIFIYLLNYLTASKKENLSILFDNKTKEYLRTLLKEKDKEISLLNEKFERLEDSLIFLNDTRTNEYISDIDKNILIEKIKNYLGNETIKKIFNDETQIIKDDLKENLGVEMIKKSFEQISKRIENELFTLKKRANLNLLFGILITIVALSMLWINLDLFYSDFDKNFKGAEAKDILLYLLPRLFMIIFTELFALFFLRLYAKGLNEIKYFQNELTNIELKLVAVEVAYITKNDASMKDSLNILAQTERNFILKKGETTVELERAKSESENVQNILKAVPDFFKNKGK
ncbi:hypothetical protein O8C86_05815 [Aliarcobacter butzleri]|uniref:hypothetical protein n=1 Tax=Aliarcobacter butzleri TaxID=28197 RepID=UPI00263EB631|nr:hypothetical protein [Aliarcobacter butzleri]MDN5061358.1 hypothetical protein [Aliarcobacter butzleri]